MDVEWDWFDTDDELLDGPQMVFIGVVRAQAIGWSWCRPIDTMAMIGEDDRRELRLILDVPPGKPGGAIWGTLGVFFSGDSIRCGETHTQEFSRLLRSTSRVDNLDAFGAPEQLGAMAASWLERTAALTR
jgi:hypothetical protein